MSTSARATVICWSSGRGCLRCGRVIDVGEPCTVTRGGSAWLHPQCAERRSP